MHIIKWKYRIDDYETVYQVQLWMNIHGFKGSSKYISSSTGILMFSIAVNTPEDEAAFRLKFGL